jgi:hypothetical protein
VHAQPDDDINIAPSLAVVSDKLAQDHQRHDLRLEYRWADEIRIAQNTYRLQAA